MDINNRTGVGLALLTLARLGLARLGFALLSLAIMGSARVGSGWHTWTRVSLACLEIGSTTLC